MDILECGYFRKIKLYVIRLKVTTDKKKKILETGYLTPDATIVSRVTSRTLAAVISCEQETKTIFNGKKFPLMKQNTSIFRKS